jgi:zinc transporter ZupT
VRCCCLPPPGILAFAAASPLAALVTYVLLARLPFVTTGGNIALILLFSGGTVLYAASQHIQPSTQHSHGGANEGGSGHGLDRISLGLMTAGMLAPLLLSALLHDEGHGH